MGERPSPEHSLDRIDNNKGYSPENCRWSTLSTQSNNRRTNHMIAVGGQLMTVGQAASMLGLPWTTTLRRWREGIVKYQLIYCDPPWQYADKANAGKRGACHKYDVMSIEQIKALAVGEIADSSCLLAMWWVPLCPKKP